MDAPPSSGPDARPILVFGGTFDPPHNRHVALLSGADRLLHAKRVIVIPAWANPQRPAGPKASGEDRAAMCELAFSGLADTQVSTIELEAKEPCYTVDTMTRLLALQQRGEIPSGPFRLLIGSDQALHFKTWKDWERLLTLCKPVVALRPPHERWAWENLLREVWDEAWTRRWLDWTLPIDPVDISSTAVRAAVAAGSPIDDQVPEPVDAYIASRRLYGSRGVEPKPDAEPPAGA